MLRSRPCFDTIELMKLPVTIYHNPRCSKSRQTLALLEERGIEPRVVAYLEHGCTDPNC